MADRVYLHPEWADLLSRIGDTFCELDVSEQEASIAFAEMIRDLHPIKVCPNPGHVHILGKPKPAQLNFFSTGALAIPGIYEEQPLWDRALAAQVVQQTELLEGS